MSVRSFGRDGDQEILEVTLEHPSGMRAKVITWGAVVRDLVVPAPGGPQRVLLGYERLEHYVEHSPYFGAIVGRHANRIGAARFTLDGTERRLAPNEKGNQLHGGPRGFGQRPWRLVDRSPDSCTLVLVSEDGDMGYPGRLLAQCRYVLTGPGTLRIVLEATADAPTPVNLTTHGYFNLDGQETIADHRLQIAADHVTAVDDALIPTGEIRAVAGTPLDFREARRIGLPSEREGLRFDHNFVLRGGSGGGIWSEALHHAATLSSERSRLALEIWTTEPGLQFYDGHLLDSPVPGIDDARYGLHHGLCLEPQRFPDGPNHAHFPACILRPGGVSRQASELRFHPIPDGT